MKGVTLFAAMGITATGRNPPCGCWHRPAFAPPPHRGRCFQSEQRVAGRLAWGGGEAHVEPSRFFSSSSVWPRLQKHPEMSSCKKTRVTPVALESLMGHLSSGVFSCASCSHGCHSASMASFQKCTAAKKIINSRWETKACLFQLESQTGTCQMAGVARETR